MQRWKLTIEYDGHPFAGWQIQDDAPSVQQTLMRAVYDFSGEIVDIYAAGRTDAGVHARGQVAHLDLAKECDADTVRKAINAHVKGKGVAVLSAEAVSHDFHARFGAVRRAYSYRMLIRPTEPVLEAGRVWHVRHALDERAMKEGATYFLGHHDFSSFRAAACQAKTPLRTIDRFDIETSTRLDGGQEIVFTIAAKSFLHHQVRNMVGTLKEIGEGKYEPAMIQTMLAAKDRAAAGVTAPAHGLYFDRVDY